MNPAVLEIDFDRFRGDTYKHLVQVMSNQTNLPMDITGCDFIWTIDPNPDPTDNTTKVLEMVGVIEDAPSGQVSFAPVDASAADVAPDTYFYNVQMTDAGGAIRTIMYGKYTIKQDIPK